MTNSTSAVALATISATAESAQPSEQATFAVYLWLSQDEEMRSTAAWIANASQDTHEAGQQIRKCAERAIGRRPLRLCARIRATLTQDVDWTVIGQSFRADDAFDDEVDPLVRNITPLSTRAM
jgi:hypothetical protein